VARSRQSEQDRGQAWQEESEARKYPVEHLAQVLFEGQVMQFAEHTRLKTQSWLELKLYPSEHVEQVLASVQLRQFGEQEEQPPD
jgi:hypothetical protein